jgi:hypothetical protein
MSTNLNARSALQASLIADVPKLSPDEQRFMRRIFDRVLIVGRANYSPWVAANDKRDMAKEMADESLDRAIYGAMDDVIREDERARRRLAVRHDEAFAKVQDAIRSSFVIDDEGTHEVLP